MTEPDKSINRSLASKDNCISESIKAHQGWLASFTGSWLSLDIRLRRAAPRHPRGQHFVSRATWLTTQPFSPRTGKDGEFVQRGSQSQRSCEHLTFHVRSESLAAGPSCTSVLRTGLQVSAKSSALRGKPSRSPHRAGTAKRQKTMKNFTQCKPVCFRASYKLRLKMQFKFIFQDIS